MKLNVIRNDEDIRKVALVIIFAMLTYYVEVVLGSMYVDMPGQTAELYLPD